MNNRPTEDRIGRALALRCLAIVSAAQRAAWWADDSGWPTPEEIRARVGKGRLAYSGDGWAGIRPPAMTLALGGDCEDVATLVATCAAYHGRRWTVCVRRQDPYAAHVWTRVDGVDYDPEGWRQ